MATSKAIINASEDYDLLKRAMAIAAEKGIVSPQQWVEERAQALACAPVDDSGNSVASVYEYADTNYEQALAQLVKPGVNPAAVTDDHLRHAIDSLKSATPSA